MGTATDPLSRSARQQRHVVIVKNSANLDFQDALMTKHDTIELFREIVRSLAFPITTPPSLTTTK
ncbi:hypothetical protein ACWXWU_17765 [Shewanella sp. A14]